jgi:hypothetical protein
MSSDTAAAATEPTEPPVSEERFRGQYDLQMAVESSRDSHVRRLVEQTPAGATPQSVLTLSRQQEAVERRTPIEISYQQPLVTLDNEMTPALVKEFRNQARNKPSLVPSEVVTGTARIRIRLALTGDPPQTFVRLEHINKWWEHVNISQTSDIVSRYFLQTEVGFDIPIAEVLNNMSFKFNLAKEEVEDSTFIRLELALVRYFETHAQENTTTLNELALIIERKLPRNSQLQADYMSKKIHELDAVQEDTPLLVISRIKRFFRIH